MTDIASRLIHLKQQIAQTCNEAGRDPASVQLLAVSKTMGIDAVQAAVDAGQIHFGENYLQDALPKTQMFPSLTWHFVGAIQSNKTRDIASHFDWIHTVSSTKIAKRLSDQRDPSKGPINCLIQVNLSGESQKSGVSVPEAKALAAAFPEFENIKLRGLMTMPAASASKRDPSSVFQELRELRDELSSTLAAPDIDQLSMGMTNDYIEAIRQGATWIRIGTAIFGPRNT